MVRQALMNAASQLKASALVSFTPKDGQNLDEQLQALRDRGVTDALFAQLECAQVRCEIELQRIDPSDRRIKKQAGFTFLTDKQQEASYRVSNTVSHLFPPGYIRQDIIQELMSGEDYEIYLNIVDRSEKRLARESDLELLDELLLRYPKNANLYRTYIQAVTSLHTNTSKSEFIAKGINVLAKAKLHGVSERILLELELWLRTYDTDRETFDKLLKQLLAFEFPPAELLSKYARFLYIQGEYNLGIRYANEAVNLNPSKPNLYLLALNHYGNGSYQEANRVLQNIIRKYPDHWSSYGLLGAIFVEMGEYSKARSVISEIPPESRTWHDYSNLGVANLLQKNYEDARLNYMSALELAPTNLTVLGNIAEIYTITNNRALQQKYYKKILELTEKKTGIESKMYRALSLAYLGKISEAITLIHRLNQEFPKDTSVKYASAQIYILGNEYRSAAVYINQLLEQGMSADWFSLPIFQQICTQTETPLTVTDKICY